jgi:hypothetical protein
VRSPRLRSPRSRTASGSTGRWPAKLSLRDRLATLAFCSLEGRIATFLLDVQRLANLTPSFRLTQGMIASAVGASRPKVNRCLKILERRGLIAWRKASGPEILDPVGLWRLT